MRLKNALSVTADNFNVVFKLLLYRVIVGIVFFALCYTILTLNLRGIVQSAESQNILTLLKEFFTALTSGDTEYLQGFHEAFADALVGFWDMLSLHMGSIIGSVVGIVVLFLVQRFLGGLGTFAMGCLVNDKMHDYAKTKFSSAYFKNLGKAALYQIIYVPLSFLYAVLMVGLCWFLFFYALSFLPLIITLMLAVTAAVCLEALKFTLISAWVPRLLNEQEKHRVSMAKSFSQKLHFKGRFGGYLFNIYFIIVLNIVCAVCTLGSALLITLPLSYIETMSIQLVNYYEDTGRRYFVGRNTVVQGEGVPSEYES